MSYYIYTHILQCTIHVHTHTYFKFYARIHLSIRTYIPKYLRTCKCMYKHEIRIHILVCYTWVCTVVFVNLPNSAKLTLNEPLLKYLWKLNTTSAVCICHKTQSVLSVQECGTDMSTLCGGLFCLQSLLSFLVQV